MTIHLRNILIWGTLVFAAAWRPAFGGITPERAYAPLGRPALILVDPPHDQDTDAATGTPAPMELVLRTWWDAEVERAPVAPGKADLVALFPSLVQTPPARALRLRLERSGKPDGTPMVIVPMWSAPRYETALSALAREALASRSKASLERLLATGRSSASALEFQVIEADAGPRIFSGYRLMVEKRVRLRTSLGEMEFMLRHDAAPNTAAAFLRLVEGGFYDGAPIHRIAPGGPDGTPVFVQAGDPTGTGAGGCGERLPYEPAADWVRQAAGVLSVARTVGDPNSASGQIVIALDGSSGAGLDHGATPIGEITRGASVLRAFAEVPLGPREPQKPGSPRDLPLAQLVIERAWTVDAPAEPIAPAERHEPEPEPEPVVR